MYGFQAFDESGNLQIDITDSLPRLGGSLTTGSVDGSITDPLIGSVPSARVWYSAQQIDGATAIPRDSAMPTITVSGSTLSWTYTATIKPDARITWGVF